MGATKKIFFDGKDYYTVRNLLRETRMLESRAIQEGWTLPSKEILEAINIKIRFLKKTGRWDRRDFHAHFAYGDSSLQNFARINWKNPNGALLLPSGLIGYGDYGFIGNGVTGYVDTMFNPVTSGVHYTQNDAGRSFIMVFIGNAITEAAGTTNQNRTNATAGGSATQRINQGAASVNLAVDITGTGKTSIARLNSTNVRLIKNAVEYNRTATSAAMANVNQHLLRTQGVFSTNTMCDYIMEDSHFHTLAEMNIERAMDNLFFTRIGLSPIA